MRVKRLEDRHHLSCSDAVFCGECGEISDSLRHGSACYGCGATSGTISLEDLIQRRSPVANRLRSSRLFRVQAA
jgi:hypothetical protein